MKEQIKGALKYLRYERRRAGLGTSHLAPLILMINDEERIVEQLLDESDFDSKGNLLTFLDYGLRNSQEDRSYTDEETYEAIVYTLTAFRDMNEDKWEINGEELVKRLKEGLK